MPLVANITASVAALMSTTSAVTQPLSCYSDSGLIKIHDQLFSAMNTPSCYIADCSPTNVHRCIITNMAQFKSMVVQTNMSTIDYNVFAKRQPSWFTTFYAECRPNVQKWAQHEMGLLSNFVDRLLLKYPLLWTVAQWESSISNYNISMDVQKMSLDQLHKLLEHVMVYNGLVNKGESNYNALVTACDVKTEFDALNKNIMKTAKTVKKAFAQRATYLREDIEETLAYVKRSLGATSVTPAPSGSGML